MTWRLKVDQDVVPDWFQPEFDELRVKEAVKAWWKEHAFAEGQHVVRDGIYYAYDSSTVTAYGSSAVVLPLYKQTTGVIGLSGNAICINHKTRTFRSCSAWKMEVGK